MSLAKLSKKNDELNRWAQQRAVETVASIPSQHLIVGAYLFGSAVNGIFTEESDLDLLILVDTPDAATQL